MPVRNVEYLDGPEAHLPHGMRHVGYDADAATHQYRDVDGSLWQSAPGNRYGRLRLVSRPPPPTDRGVAGVAGVGRSATVASAGSGKWARRESQASTLVGDDEKKGEVVRSQRRRRRFTSFDQLYEGEAARPRASVGGGAGRDPVGGGEEGDDGRGMLRRLGRSLSTRLRAGSGAGGGPPPPPPAAAATTSAAAAPPAAVAVAESGLAAARSTVAKIKSAAAGGDASAAAAERQRRRRRAAEGAGGGARRSGGAGLGRRGTV
jgi:hypothetical protein